MIQYDVFSLSFIVGLLKLSAYMQCLYMGIRFLSGALRIEPFFAMRYLNENWLVWNRITRRGVFTRTTWYNLTVLLLYSV
jgi:hypothetical protein